MSETVRNNPAAGRYEVDAGDDVAFAAYEVEGDVVTFTHTVVPEAAQGRGVASRLIEAALADARASHLRIVPRCAFVARYVATHPETRDLLAPRA